MYPSLLGEGDINREGYSFVRSSSSRPDLVNKAPVINGWRKEEPCSCGYNYEHGHDEIFKHIYLDTDWESGLQYAQEIGLGCREYELVEV